MNLFSSVLYRLYRIQACSLKRNCDLEHTIREVWRSAKFLILLERSISLYRMSIYLNSVKSWKSRFIDVGSAISIVMLFLDTRVTRVRTLKTGHRKIKRARLKRIF